MKTPHQPSKKRYSPLIFRSGVATIDQAVLSALNFFIAILLIKGVDKAEYGYYSIAFPISLFLVSIQNALVNTPHAVLLYEKDHRQQKVYSSALWMGQWVVALPTILISFLLIWAGLYLGFDDRKVYIAAAVCFAAAGILSREFFRAYCFARENPLLVLKMDLFYVFAIAILVAAAYLFYEISVPAIFVITGFGGLIVGLLVMRKMELQFCIGNIKTAYGENWIYGRWSLLGVIVTHIQKYCYLYLLGLLIDSAAVAEVSASRLLLMPMAMILIGWNKIAIPHGAKLRESHQLNRFYKEQICASLVFIVVVFAYSAVILVLSPVVLNTLLTEKYYRSFEFLFMWSTIIGVGFVNHTASWGLQVAKKFHIIFQANLITMVVTLVSAYFFIQHMAIRGGLTSLLIGESLLAVFLWYHFTKTVYGDRLPYGIRGQKAQSSSVLQNDLCAPKPK